MKLYKAVDTHDGKLSLFLVNGNRMAVSYVPVDFTSPWEDIENVVWSEWADEPLDYARMDNPMLICETEDEND